jgi:hypothetical protein
MTVNVNAQRGQQDNMIKFIHMIVFIVVKNEKSVKPESRNFYERN